MNAERIRKAAEWARGWTQTSLPDQRAADAAHILGKLAAGEWVLCQGEPVAWTQVDDGDYDVPLHARIPEEP